MGTRRARIGGNENAIGGPRARTEVRSVDALAHRAVLKHERDVRRAHPGCRSPARRWCARREGQCESEASRVERSTGNLFMYSDWRVPARD